MTPRVSPELERLVEEFEILSPTRLRVGKRMRQVGGPSPLITLSPSEPSGASTPEAALRGALADELYSGFYARATADSPPPPNLGAHRDHLVALAGANTSTSSWEPGWRVRAVAADGRVSVEGHGLLFLAPADDVRPEGAGLAAGERCRVRVPGEMRALRPGFYSAIGDADAAAPTEFSRRVRLYWHLRPVGAPIWVRSVTRGLNERGIPFQMKVVADPRFYLRADAGVLTLEPQHYPAARPVVEEAYRGVRAHLRPTVPGLTHELAPGLGVAEGAADGSSFGAHRCRLIAQALAALGPRGTEASTRLEAVAASFRAAGLDPAEPHLAAGSTSRYQALANDLGSPHAGPGSPQSGAPGVSRPADALAAAAGIGDTICRSAYHLEGRSNWLGRVFVDHSPTATVGALGADLFGGTAGIALFLAELYALAGNPDYRATALGAIRQALRAVAREPDRSRPVGFFEGQLGIGWAARIVAARTGDEALAAEADLFVSSLARELPGERHWDLLGGSAGAVLAFLRLHEETGDSTFLEAATKLGRGLLPPGPGGNPIPSDPGRPPLTGFAHGAAGVGLALLELSVATGETALRQAAGGCFAYESAHFDAGRRNWPDYRRVALDRRRALTAPPGLMTGWCHGAPGIALSRLRAMEVDPDGASSHEPAARAGLAATLEAIDSGLAGAPTDVCLCHGLAGLADILAIGARVLEEPALAGKAKSAIDSLAARYSPGTPGPGREPAASGRLDNPSLFLGDAGVGYALLRIGDPDRVATLLLPAGREAGTRQANDRLEDTTQNRQTPVGNELQRTTTP